MEDERSVLQQIRDKELEFNSQIESVRMQCDEKVNASRNEATEILKKAEESAVTAADEYYREEKKKTEAEIERIKTESKRITASIQATGKTNLAKAVEKIVSDVSSR